MKKHLFEYISLFGILVCIGLFLYNTTELKKISVQYDRIQTRLSQIAADGTVHVQANSQDTQSYYSLEKDEYLHSSESLNTKADIISTECDTDGVKSNYSLEKTEYLHSEPLDIDLDTVTSIPMPTYWEWEWEGPTISPEEAAQYDLVKYGYLVE